MGAWHYRYIPIVAGFAMMYASWLVGDRAQWWSDALMTIGAAFALVTPLLSITKGIETRTSRQIVNLEQKVDADVAAIKRSLSERQEYVQEKLKERRSQAIRDVLDFLDETTRETVVASLKAAKSMDLLSPVGVRGTSPLGPFDVRLQLLDERLWFHLDYQDEPSVHRREWRTGISLEDLMLELSTEAERYSTWAGDIFWDFRTNLIEIGAVFAAAIDMRSKGTAVNKVVQIFPDEWLLSDWDVKSLRKSYQITYDRLDELDWEEHLCGKSWTDDGVVYEMLQAARLIKALAEQDGSPPE